MSGLSWGESISALGARMGGGGRLNGVLQQRSQGQGLSGSRSQAIFFMAQQQQAQAAAAETAARKKITSLDGEIRREVETISSAASDLRSSLFSVERAASGVSGDLQGYVARARALVGDLASVAQAAESTYREVRSKFDAARAKGGNFATPMVRAFESVLGTVKTMTRDVPRYRDDLNTITRQIEQARQAAEDDARAAQARADEITRQEEARIQAIEDAKREREREIQSAEDERYRREQVEVDRQRQIRSEESQASQYAIQIEQEQNRYRSEVEQQRLQMQYDRQERQDQLERDRVASEEERRDRQAEREAATAQLMLQISLLEKGLIDKSQLSIPGIRTAAKQGYNPADPFGFFTTQQGQTSMPSWFQPMNPAVTGPPAVQQPFSAPTPFAPPGGPPAFAPGAELFGMGGLVSAANSTLPPGALLEAGYQIEGPLQQGGVGVFRVTRTNKTTFTMSAQQAFKAGASISDPETGNVFYTTPSEGTSSLDVATAINAFTQALIPGAMAATSIYQQTRNDGRPVTFQQPQQESPKRPSGWVYALVGAASLGAAALALRTIRRK